MTTVLFDNVSTSGIEASLSTYNFTLAVANNPNRVLIVVATCFTGVIVNNITYNGVNLTHIAAADITKGSSHIEMWYLVNPATGTNTVSVTFSGTTSSISNAASYYNADQNTPIGKANTNNGNGGTPSIALTTPADGSFAIGALVTATSTGIGSTGGQNSRENTAIPATGTVALDDKGPISPLGSVTLSWTGQGASDNWATTGISIRVPGGSLNSILFGAIP